MRSRCDRDGVGFSVMGAGLFVPPAYRADDPAAIVRAYPFAQLVTSDADGIHATATPIFFEHADRTDVLVGHLARRNPQAAALVPGMPALAIFAGPHAYISARWYREKPQVPTWDYVAAHVRGTLEPIDDEEDQRAILALTAARLEPVAEPWMLEHAPDGRVAALMPMIRSFRIRVERLEGVTKLSQTHPVGDRVHIVERLRETEDGAAIARLIAALPDQ